MTVARRGMLGLPHDGHVDALTERYDLAQLRELGGIVDYVVGSQPGPGVFCLAEQPDPRQQHYLDLYKLGKGPLYSFYTPYHLCHFEAPNTIARAVLFGDAAARPLGGPLVEVCAVAKRDLTAGEVLDNYGHFMTYGEAVSEAERRQGGYLPEGLVEGCRLRRAIARDAVITFDDVELPAGRLADRLYAEQVERFG
jgi:predicted homoserine dehydrogenase-like protein